MPPMSAAEYRGFVTAGTRTAKWATTRRDGRPHVVPVWFVLEGDELLITTASKSVKGRAVLRDPRVALCIDDDRPPYAFVLIEGRATSAPTRMRCYAPPLSSPPLCRGGAGAGVRPAQWGRGDAAGPITPAHMVSENNITGEPEQATAMSTGRR